MSLICSRESLRRYVYIMSAGTFQMKDVTRKFDPEIESARRIFSITHTLLSSSLPRFQLQASGGGGKPLLMLTPPRCPVRSGVQSAARRTAALPSLVHTLVYTHVRTYIRDEDEHSYRGCRTFSSTNYVAAAAMLHSSK